MEARQEVQSLAELDEAHGRISRREVKGVRSISLTPASPHLRLRCPQHNTSKALVLLEAWTTFTPDHTSPPSAMSSTRHSTAVVGGWVTH